MFSTFPSYRHPSTQRPTIITTTHNRDQTHRNRTRSLSEPSFLRLIHEDGRATRMDEYPNRPPLRSPPLQALQYRSTQTEVIRLPAVHDDISLEREARDRFAVGERAQDGRRAGGGYGGEVGGITREGGVGEGRVGLFERDEDRACIIARYGDGMGSFVSLTSNAASYPDDEHVL